MNLKATYRNGKAIIYNDKGEAIASTECRDAREAQVWCLSNPATRKTILDKLHVISVKIAWVEEAETVIFELEEAAEAATKPVAKVKES